MARGGKRQGTQGKGYANRTDLMQNYAPEPTARTPASAPTAAPTQQTQQMQQYITPDMVPKLDDPTSRPHEPVTTGLPIGPGAGPEALGPMPPGPEVQSLQAAYLANPTPQLRHALYRLKMKGAL